MTMRAAALALGLLIGTSAPAQVAPDAGAAAPRRGDVLIGRIQGPITPVTLEYVKGILAKARDQRQALVVLEMDTPGGLVVSTEQIIQAILASEAPVVVYVTPAGAQATSAGLYIMNAADVAAMSPGTRIGAGHPVTVSGGNPGGEGAGSGRNFLNEKIENTMAAGVRAIAATRGRNAAIYEKMVRESISLTAQEAVEQHVVDLIAGDLTQLLSILDGRQITRFDGSKQTVSVADARRDRIEMTLRQRILFWLTDPQIAFVLIGIGMLGLYIEFNHPGLIVPGVVGALAFVLLAMSLQVLPVNILGIVLILLAGVLLILEIKVTSYGLLTLGGIISLTLGFLTLFDLREVPSLRPSLGFILPTSLTIGVIMAVVTTLAIGAQRSRVVTGREGLVGAVGKALTDIGTGGKVFVHGEYWDAVSHEPIARGSSVRIVSMRGMAVEVQETE